MLMGIGKMSMLQCKVEVNNAPILCPNDKKWF